MSIKDEKEKNNDFYTPFFSTIKNTLYHLCIFAPNNFTILQESTDLHFLN